MNQKNDGKLGQTMVLQSMQAAVAQQRSAGQTTVPIAWVDSWITQLQSEQYPYPYAPLRPYSFFDTFHPVDTFVPLFAERVTFRTTTTLK
jgi:hypothetical protein